MDRTRILEKLEQADNTSNWRIAVGALIEVINGMLTDDERQALPDRLDAVEAAQANLPMRMALAIRDLQPDPTPDPSITQAEIDDWRRQEAEEAAAGHPDRPASPVSQVAP